MLHLHLHLHLFPPHKDAKGDQKSATTFDPDVGTPDGTRHLTLVDGKRTHRGTESMREIFERTRKEEEMRKAKKKEEEATDAN